MPLLFFMIIWIALSIMFLIRCFCAFLRKAPLDTDLWPDGGA